MGWPSWPHIHDRLGGRTTRPFRCALTMSTLATISTFIRNHHGPSTSLIKMASSPHPPRGSSLATVPDRVLSSKQADAQARRAARRSQMQSYYGLTPSSPSSNSSPTPSTSTHPTHPTSIPTTANANLNPNPPAKARTDFNSPHFAPSAYYEDLLTRASLPGLLRTTTTLATDVGRLHSSRHTLVYNHHHQLFSAGDTIAALNARTPQLLSIVTELQERFSEMSQLADSVGLPSQEASEEERRKVGVEVGIERVRLLVAAGEAGRARELLRGVEAAGGGEGLEEVRRLVGAA